MTDEWFPKITFAMIAPCLRFNRPLERIYTALTETEELALLPGDGSGKKN
jgi:hypothetical protein